MIYGMVIFVKICHQLAPSIFAASYWSAGMFCRMPVICMMVYGIPTHRLMTMTVTRAHVAFVKNGSGSVIQPHVCNMRLTAPCGWSMVCMTSKDTNCGTAIDMEKHGRQKPLPRVVLRLMIMATNMPRKKFRNVAKNAHTKVQISTRTNSPALTVPPLLENTVAKFFRPTQSKRTRFLWS